MKVTWRIAFRNLVRQRRRNILLGIGIAFGMMILVMTNSFTNGLTDIIINEVIVNMNGHTQVYQSEKIDGKTTDIIRDMPHAIDVITNTIDNVDHVRENVVAFSRVVGNGSGDMMVIGGMPLIAVEYYATLTLSEGDIGDMTNGKYPNPMVLYSGKAKTLNLSAYDTLKAKFYTVSGQMQSARFTVVAIVKSDNEFMDMIGFTDLDTLKELMGYEEHETMMLNVILDRIKNPYVTLLTASKLHSAFEPEIATVYGTFDGKATGSILAFKTNDSVVSNVEDRLGVSVTIDEDTPYIYLGEEIANEIGAQMGHEISFSYETRFGEEAHSETFIVAGIYEGSASMPGDTALIDQIDLYEFYYENLPPLLENMPEAFLPADSSDWSDDLALEYTLLPQTVQFPELEGLDDRQKIMKYPKAIADWKKESKTSFIEQFNKKWREYNRTKWAGSTMDVISMQEMADMFLQIESALDLISLVIVLILFFIILIGVVNSLRMSIRERTREIGTTRAIGMQIKDVRQTFVRETVLLTFFAGLVGIVAGLLMTGLFSLFTFQADGLISLFLVDGHLHFIPQVWSILNYLGIIIVITLITAFFPARRAAKLTVAGALRHYE